MPSRGEGPSGRGTGAGAPAGSAYASAAPASRGRAAPPHRLGGARAAIRPGREREVGEARRPLASGAPAVRIEAQRVRHQRASRCIVSSRSSRSTPVRRSPRASRSLDRTRGGAGGRAALRVVGSRQRSVPTVPEPPKSGQEGPLVLATLAQRWRLRIPPHAPPPVPTRDVGPAPARRHADDHRATLSGARLRAPDGLQRARPSSARSPTSRSASGSGPAGRKDQRWPSVARIRTASFIARSLPWHSYGPAEKGK